MHIDDYAPAFIDIIHTHWCIHIYVIRMYILYIKKTQRKHIQNSIFILLFAYHIHRRKYIYLHRCMYTIYIYIYIYIYQRDLVLNNTDRIE